MKVYRVKSDVAHYQYFLPKREQDWFQLETDCVSKSENWVPPEIYVFKPKHKVGDFYQFGDGKLITSPRATEVLRTYFEMAGELLPLFYQGEEYTLLNVLECINCLDEEQSIWIETNGIRNRLGKYAFYPERFTESPLFKIPQTSRVEILLVEGLVSPDEEFRYLAEQAGLRGLIFEELWRDEP